MPVPVVAGHAKPVDKAAKRVETGSALADWRGGAGAREKARGCGSARGHKQKQAPLQQKPAAAAPHGGNSGGGVGGGDYGGGGSGDDLNARAQELQRQRDKARAMKDWATADALRDQINRLGVRVRKANARGEVVVAVADARRTRSLGSIGLLSC